MKARLVGILFLTLGCGGGGDPTAPDPIILVGEWTYFASNVAGGGVSCFIDLDLDLSQSGDTFTGDYFGFFDCGDGEDFVSGVVTNGRLNGQSVSFDLDTPDFHNSGSISGASMSGTVTVRFVFDGQTVILTGNWSATR